MTPASHATAITNTCHAAAATAISGGGGRGRRLLPGPVVICWCGGSGGGCRSGDVTANRWGSYHRQATEHPPQPTCLSATATRLAAAASPPCLAATAGRLGALMRATAATITNECGAGGCSSGHGGCTGSSCRGEGPKHVHHVRYRRHAAARTDPVARWGGLLQPRHLQAAGAMQREAATAATATTASAGGRYCLAAATAAKAPR